MTQIEWILTIFSLFMTGIGIWFTWLGLRVGFIIDKGQKDERDRVIQRKLLQIFRRWLVSNYFKTLDMVNVVNRIDYYAENRTVMINLIEEIDEVTFADEFHYSDALLNDLNILSREKEYYILMSNQKNYNKETDLIARESFYTKVYVVFMAIKNVGIKYENSRLVVGDWYKKIHVRMMDAPMIDVKGYKEDLHFKR